jgi:hypothetical protein
MYQVVAPIAGPPAVLPAEMLQLFPAPGTKIAFSTL